MLAHGFLAECEQLMPLFDQCPNHPVFKSIGYAQAFHTLRDISRMMEMVERVNIATRQYAKKQMTWLRSWSPNADLVLQWGETQEVMMKQIQKLLNNHLI